MSESFKVGLYVVGKVVHPLKVWQSTKISEYTIVCEICKGDVITIMGNCRDDCDKGSTEMVVVLVNARGVGYVYSQNLCGTYLC